MNHSEQDQRTPLEDRLSRALVAEAHQLQPDEDALRLIAARVAADPGGLVRHRRRRRRVLVGVVSAGLAAAVTAAALTAAPRPDTGTDPRPARMPTVAVPDERFDPSSPRTSWTVYRVGDDPDRAGFQAMLFAEEVRASAPYQPREALQQLSTLPSADPGTGVDLDVPRDQVGEVSASPTSIVVDLTTLGTSRAPGGRTAAETAAAWVQALVVTAQDAYGTDKPVVFTLDGARLSSLHGVDTREPVRRGALELGHAQAVFLPRPGDEVTAPVTLSANPPPGVFHWRVESLTDGATVFEENTEDRTGSGASGFRTGALVPGAYRFSVRRILADEPEGTPGWERTVDFRVRTGDPAVTAPPVTDPATDPVPVTPVYFPAADGLSLIEELRPRTSAAAAVEAVVAGSAADPKLDRTGLSGEGVTVAESDELVRVDFDLLSQGAGARKAPELAGQALVHTLDGFYGRSRPVVVTVRGRPATVPGSPARLVSMAVATLSAPGLFTPRPDTTVDDPLTVVGRAAQGNTALTWYLIDPVSRETRFQGSTAVDPTSQVYAFSLPVPAGDYLLQTVQKIGEHRTRVNHAVTVQPG